MNNRVLFNLKLIIITALRKTDEKVFSAAAPTNPQDDLLYTSVITRKKDIPATRLLRTRPTFSKSLMVSVGVSALGRTSLHFVDPGVKVNGQYYRDIPLTRDLLPDIRQFSELRFNRMGPLHIEPTRRWNCLQGRPPTSSRRPCGPPTAQI